MRVCLHYIMWYAHAAWMGNEYFFALKYFQGDNWNIVGDEYRLEFKMNRHPNYKVCFIYYTCEIYGLCKILYIISNAKMIWCSHIQRNVFTHSYYEGPTCIRHVFLSRSFGM